MKKNLVLFISLATLLLSACSFDPVTQPSSAFSAGTVQRRGTDNAEMVYVPAGEFLMGSTEKDIDYALTLCPKCKREYFDDEKPQHTVYLDPFWIDKYEVTNALYKKCVEAGRCSGSAPGILSVTRSSYYGNSTYDNYPVIYMQHADALGYCAWAGKHLPTEAQWEKAARGTDARIYPWGNTYDKNYLNFDNKGDTTEVGKYPSDVSPYGAMDMAGNVSEWVADSYDSNYYTNSPRNNPKGPLFGIDRVFRGGSWYSLRGAAARSSSRGISGVEFFLFTLQEGDLGFRCAE